MAGEVVGPLLLENLVENNDGIVGVDVLWVLAYVDRSAKATTTETMNMMINAIKVVLTRCNDMFQLLQGGGEYRGGRYA